MQWFYKNCIAVARKILQTVFKNATKRKRFSKVYYNWIQFSMQIFRVLKWFKNHHIRYLSSFAAISVSDFKIAYKRRYPNLSFSHVFLFELILDYLQNTSSNILKIQMNSVSAYQNEIWIKYRRLVCSKVHLFWPSRSIFSNVYINSETVWKFPGSRAHVHSMWFQECLLLWTRGKHAV